jgi:hypothetical protein
MLSGAWKFARRWVQAEAFARTITAAYRQAEALADLAKSAAQAGDPYRAEPCPTLTTAVLSRPAMNRSRPTAGTSHCSDLSLSGGLVAVP